MPHNKIEVVFSTSCINSLSKKIDLLQNCLTETSLVPYSREPVIKNKKSGEYFEMRGLN
jgi:hypothetical protein